MLSTSIFALLAFAGFGLSLFMPSTSDELEDDDETSAHSDEPVILEINEDAEAAALGETLTGSEFDDDILIEDVDVGTLQTIDVGDGDDYVSVRETYADDLSVYGGAGADSIGGYEGNIEFYGGAGNDFVGAGRDVVGYGDEGDDRLYGSDGSRIYGGEGNDILNGETVDQFRYNLGRSAYGGDGDDTLIIKRTAGNVATDEDTFGEWQGFSDGHYGGEGADTFQVEIDQNSNTDFFYLDEDEEDQQRLLTLPDFTAGEDVLDLTFVDMTIASVNLVQVTDHPHGHNGTRVELTYEHIVTGDPDDFDDYEIGDTALLVANVYLGDTSVTMDDIRISSETTS